MDANLVPALAELSRSARQRMAERQQGVDTFYDSFLLAADRLATARPDEALRRLADRRDEILHWAGAGRREARFVPPEDRDAYRYELRDDRLGYQHVDSDVPTPVMQAAQGVRGCLTYHGRSLFKTVYDLAIYPMLIEELRPEVVIEIGSGTGASAVWLTDVLRNAGLPDTVVWSFDIAPPPLVHPGVRFGRFDCRRPDTLPLAFLESIGHPALVIEDAHVNVAAVLDWIHPHLRPGDYLYVEDTVLKMPAMRRFTAGTNGAYAIDTHYTDFFGRNATCAIDGILVRMAPTIGCGR
jgi:cephalosporin hydroxylase